MRVLFAGTPEAAVPSLRAILASRHDLVAVLTRPDAPAGRGRILTPSPVATMAGDAGVENRAHGSGERAHIGLRSGADDVALGGDELV